MRARGIVLATALAALAVLAWWAGGALAALALVAAALLVELLLARLVRKHRAGFPWLVTLRDDALPKLDAAGLKKFLADGYDPELGWVRRPGTQHDEVGQGGRKTTWHVDASGARANPGHEALPTLISCYGDSFTFSRQVDDHETWEWQLSEITETNVVNFGVGNYGIDQAILRMRREMPRQPTRIVVMGIVPDTISRIQSAWKHYYEYGNTFAFKPRFRLVEGALRLEPNPASDPSVFDDITRVLAAVQRRDLFYRTKFLREAMAFPYAASVLASPRRNVRLLWLLSRRERLRARGQAAPADEWAPMGEIMRVNLAWRLRLFRDREATALLDALIDAFAEDAHRAGAIPVLAFLPQKDDVNEARAHGHFYAHVVERARMKLHVFDGYEALRDRADLDALYSDANWYGGHYSKEGNRVIAEALHRSLSDAKLLSITSEHAAPRALGGAPRSIGAASPSPPPAERARR